MRPPSSARSACWWTTSAPGSAACNGATLGKYPISDGQEFPQDKGYSEINLDVGYRFNPHLRAQLTIFNLTNTRANAAAYFYASRLPGEPAEGVEDAQVHPLEPISAVAKVTYDF